MCIKSYKYKTEAEYKKEYVFLSDDTMNIYYNIEQTKKILSLSRASIYELLCDRRLAGKKEKGTWKIKEENIFNFIKNSDDYRDFYKKEILTLKNVNLKTFYIKPCKIQEDFRKIQIILFRLGYTWNSGDKDIKKLNETFILNEGTIHEMVLNYLGDIIYRGKCDTIREGGLQILDKKLNEKKIRELYLIPDFRIYKPEIFLELHKDIIFEWER